jgi:hypothetical protein
MSFWVVSFGGEEWISCFHKEDRQTNQQTKDLLLQRETHSFLSCFRSISGDEKSSFGEEGKGREENKEGEQEQEFFGLEIQFCEFSGFVVEGVDVAVVLLTVVVCG